MNLINTINKQINSSQYFFGLMMIILNLGSRYISLDLTSNQEKLLSSLLMRKITLFSIVFMATRDFIISIILTIIFSLFIITFLHEQSNFCILPNFLKKIDLDGDGQISELEFKNALNMLKKSGKLVENKEFFKIFK